MRCVAWTQAEWQHHQAGSRAAGLKEKLILPRPLHREASASLGRLEKAGLLTSFRSQAPSHLIRQWHQPEAIMKLTAARQSGTLTPFPLLIAYSEPSRCKDSAFWMDFKTIRDIFMKKFARLTKSAYICNQILDLIFQNLKKYAYREIIT